MSSYCVGIVCLLSSYFVGIVCLVYVYIPTQLYLYPNSLCVQCFSDLWSSAFSVYMYVYTYTTIPVCLMCLVRLTGKKIVLSMIKA